MLTLVRHGVLPLDFHEAVAAMKTEASQKLKGDVVGLGSKSISDPEFNKKNKHDPEHVSITTFWEAAPKVKKSAK